MPKTFSLKTLGCKLNQYESDQIAETFIRAGWRMKTFGEKVDLVIVNTCTVTDKSDKRSRNFIRRGARYAQTRGVVVTGCLVSRDRDVVEKMPEVNSVFGVHEHERLAAVAMRCEPIGQPMPVSDRCFRTRRHIKVQDGCDGSCSYCVVPSVRGKPRSTSRSQILEQAQRLIDAGCPELVLTGITIGKYKDGDTDLAALAKSIADLPGDFRLRITSIEPMHVTEKLIDIYRHEKLCSHIHLPLQSGSDSILRAMRRPYRVADYQRVLERIRAQNPSIAVGTDVIVGFPGESDADFRESVRMIEESRFAYVHQFSFSARAGTDASQFYDTITPQRNAERVEQLRLIASRTGYNYRKRFVGTTLRSVVSPDRQNRHYRAVSDNYIRMGLLDSPLNPIACGKIADVTIHETDTKQTIGIVTAASNTRRS